MFEPSSHNLPSSSFDSACGNFIDHLFCLHSSSVIFLHISFTFFTSVYAFPLSRIIVFQPRSLASNDSNSCLISATSISNNLTEEKADKRKKKKEKKKKSFPSRNVWHSFFHHGASFVPSTWTPAISLCAGDKDEEAVVEQAWAEKDAELRNEALQKFTVLAGCRHDHAHKLETECFMHVKGWT